MSAGSTEDRVRKLVVEYLALSSGDDLKLDADLIDDLGADSLDLVELIMAIEEEFAVEITDDEAEKAATVGQIVELVDAKLAARG